MRVAGDVCALSIVLSQMACSAAIRKHLQTPLLLRMASQPWCVHNNVALR